MTATERTGYITDGSRWRDRDGRECLVTEVHGAGYVVVYRVDGGPEEAATADRFLAQFEPLRGRLDP